MDESAAIASVVSVGDVVYVVVDEGEPSLLSDRFQDVVGLEPGWPEE